MMSLEFFSFMAITLSGDHDDYNPSAMRGGGGGGFAGGAPTPVAKPAARKPVGKFGTTVSRSKSLKLYALKLTRLIK